MLTSRPEMQYYVEKRYKYWAIDLYTGPGYHTFVRTISRFNTKKQAHEIADEFNTLAGHI